MCSPFKILFSQCLCQDPHVFFGCQQQIQWGHMILIHAVLSKQDTKLRSVIKINVNMKSGWENPVRKARKMVSRARASALDDVYKLLNSSSELVKYMQYQAIVIKFFNNLIHVVAHLLIMLYYKRLTLFMVSQADLYSQQLSSLKQDKILP